MSTIEMAKRWDLEDFVAIAKNRLEKEMKTTTKADAYSKGYADGLTSAIRSIEALYRDFRRGLL